MTGRTEPNIPDRVQVVVRVRPVLPHEEQESPAVTCDGTGRRVQILTPSRDEQHGSNLKRRGKPTAKQYEFDACLDGRISQEDLFKACNITQLVDAALEGYSVTIFAFGQTGAGKTFSMSGSSGKGVKAVGDDIKKSDGIIARALHYMYEAMARQVGNAAHSVKANFCEIYNEQVRDLLTTSQESLPVRNSSRYGFYVDGLTKRECPDLGDAQQAVMTALSNRIVGAHKLNRNSNRSHCLVSFQLESSPTAAAPGAATPVTADGMRRFGKISFVDLAGSERLKETETGENAKSLRETGNINRSLFALGKVIAALSQRGANTPASFIPFRESKLTQLLIDSLRGSGRALMVACCSPLLNHAEETMQTLHFASLALHVSSEPVLLLDPADQLVLDLRRTIKQLKEENAKLMAQLGAITSGQPLDPSLTLTPGPDPTPSPPAFSTPPKPKGAIKPVSVKPESYYEREGTRERLDKTTSSANSSTASSLTQPALPSQHSAPSFLKKGSRKDNAFPKRKPKSKPKPEPKGAGRAYGAYGAYGTSASYGSASSSARSSGSKEPRSAWTGPPSPQSKAKTPRAPTGLDSFPELAALEAQFQMNIEAARTVVGAPADTGAIDIDDLPAPPQETDSFPTLAEMEAKFQERMRDARATKAAGGLSHVPKPKPKPAARDESPASSTAVSVEVDPDAPKAEPKAAQWAYRNKWFGTDIEMTQAAYQVHDDLVEREGVDPASDLYYDEIERRIRRQFPDRFRDRSPSKGGGGARRSPAKERNRSPGRERDRSPSKAEREAARKEKERQLDKDMRRMRVTKPSLPTNSAARVALQGPRSDPASASSSGSAASGSSLSISGTSFQQPGTHKPTLNAWAEDPSQASSSGRAGGSGTQARGADASTSAGPGARATLSSYHDKARRSGGKKKRPKGTMDGGGVWDDSGAGISRAPGEGAARQAAIAAQAAALSAPGWTPQIASTNDFVLRRQMVLEELKKAKEDAEKEHARLYAKIKKTIRV